MMRSAKYSLGQSFKAALDRGTEKNIKMKMLSTIEKNREGNYASPHGIYSANALRTFSASSISGKGSSSRILSVIGSRMA